MKNIQWAVQRLAIMFLFFLTMTSQALAWSTDTYSDVAVEIISDEEGVLTKYDAGFSEKNTQRSYVIARDDERYRIRVRNRGNERIGVVIAVDGRNIISGRKSYLKPSERMYILGPHQSAEYEGWRTGRNRVNRFYFTGMSDSYAAAWGDYTAMGVVAVAAYKSRHKNVYVPDKYQQKTRPLDRPRAKRKRQQPGTGFGESEWSPSRIVEFSPKQFPASKEFIKYEWRSTLCKRGVISCRKKRTGHERNRFWPHHPPELGFVPFPPGWLFR